MILYKSYQPSTGAFVLIMQMMFSEVCTDTCRPWMTGYFPNTNQSKLELHDIQLHISINLLVFYHECCSLIGYATHYLSYLQWHFSSACEEDFDKVLND